MYFKVSNKDVLKGLSSNVAKCLYEVDKLSDEVFLNNNKLQSLVALEDKIEIFDSILTNGKAKDNARDNYSKNYSYFLSALNKYAETNPEKWQDVCLFVLERCVVLPIECDKEDTALKIFETLNDRGLPLEDADIFKATIYRNITEEENKNDFIEDWKNLTSICEKAGMGITGIFRLYSHVVRAETNDTSKEINLRDFYKKNNSDILNITIMPNLLELVEFWQYLHTGGEFKAESIPVDFTEENWKQIQVLYSYANDYWKHPISLFYLKNKNNPNFNEEFLVFQKKFITFLLTRFINNPTVNAVKNDIFKLCVNIWKGEAVNFPQEDLENIKNRLNDFNKGKLTFALLLLNAYSNNNQAKLTDSLNIEHILPKKWEKANFTNWQKEDADKAMNMFGNKILLEESINKSLQYSSFNYKKDGYKNSKSLKAKELASKQGDWTMADVEKCNEDFINNILTFFEANR